MVEARPTCFMLLTQLMAWAFCFALLKAGSNIAAKIAIIAMTTSNSIKVNPAGPFARQAQSVFFAQVLIIANRMFSVADRSGEGARVAPHNPVPPRWLAKDLVWLAQWVESFAEIYQRFK